MKLQISILLLFMLFASTAFSQIKYFPTVFLDIDQDGIEDVIFKYNTHISNNESMYWYAIKANDKTETEIEFAANGSYAKYLDFNDTIDENLNWQAKSLYIYSEYENKPKQWGTGNNYFIGIRIKKDGAYYYGWIRFNSKYWEVIERDFAIQPEPGKAIKAGEGIKSITPVYEGVKSNENTIAIITDFFPPFHKTYVAEYRLYIVKCSDAGELNTNKLLSVPSSNYQVVAPGKKRYSVELNENLLTIDNDTLTLSEFYQICILAYSNNNDTFPHSYILTDTVTVNVLTVSVDKPAVFDTGNKENSKDIQVKFAKSSKENFLKDYKLIILPADSATTFNLEKALAVPEQFTHAVTPSNDSVYTVENTILTDIYGNEIQQNKRYNAFILSAHDGTHSNISSLSPPSNLFILNNPDYFIVGQKDSEGVIYHKFDSETHTLDFDNDGEVDITTEVIDYIEAPGFTIINIAVFPGENTGIICSDNNLAKNMEENSALFSGYKWSSDKLTLYRYSSGNGIGEFRNRYGFIGFRKIVKNDTIYGWLKTGCCYKSILEFAFKKNSVALDKNNNSEWSDIGLDFYPPVNSFIKEYRIFIVKKDNANEVDINKLLSASKSNYQIVTPGAFEYHINLEDNLLTIDNDSIAAGKSYQIYILSYSTDTDSFPHSFFKAGNFTVNTFLPQVEKPVVIDAGDRGNSEDIQITFLKNIKENFVKTYKILILPADSTVSFNLEKAVSIPEKFLHSVTPVNDSLYTLKKLQLTDIYGNSIKQNKPYNVFILSVHDGTHSNISSLSPPSNLFVLNNPDYFIVGQKDGEGVIYHKFDSETHTLDFDNDGEVDITTEVIDYIEAPGFTKINIAVFPGENTEIICSDNNLAKNMEENSALFSGYNWSSDKLTLYRYSGGNCSDAIGEFGKIYGFIGFRKIVKNDTIYGWLKTGCCYNSILEFAFKRNTSPNSSHSIEDFTIYPNPNSDRILNIDIKEFNEGDDYSIDILNSAGIQIKSYIVSKKTFQISIATLRRGFYYVRMRSPEKQTTQKLIVL